MKILMSKLDIENAINEMNSQFLDSNHPLLGVTKDEESNSILIGLAATNDSPGQIVFATSEDNQLRFNSDGTITHNMDEIGVSNTLVRLMTEYLIKILNGKQEKQREYERFRKDKWGLFNSIISTQGFITSLATFVASCSGEQSPELMRKFYENNVKLFQGTEYEDTFNEQLEWIEKKSNFSFSYEVVEDIEEARKNTGLGAFIDDSITDSDRSSQTKSAF